jgi:hypothetical protein
MNNTLKSTSLTRAGVCSKGINKNPKLTGVESVQKSFLDEMAFNEKYYPEINKAANDFVKANKSPDWTINQENYLKKFDELKSLIHA